MIEVLILGVFEKHSKMMILNINSPTYLFHTLPQCSQQWSVDPWSGGFEIMLPYTCSEAEFIYLADLQWWHIAALSSVSGNWEGKLFELTWYLGVKNLKNKAEGIVSYVVLKIIVLLEVESQNYFK